jgi:hypothetical protein
VREPSLRGIASDIEVYDSSSIVIKDDHSVEDSECRGRNHEHVDRGDVRHVGSQEAAPSGGGLFRPPWHVSFRHGLTHLDTKLEQLAVNPRGAPQRILPYTFDESNREPRRLDEAAPACGPMSATARRAGSSYDAIAKPSSA